MRGSLSSGNPPIFNGVRSLNSYGHFQFHGGCYAADAPLPGNGLPSNHERDVGPVVVVSGSTGPWVSESLLRADFAATLSLDQEV
jgi:UDP:flavonoid glycosyltransferase YjiC (YdhE family)